MSDRYTETFKTWDNIASLYQDKFMQLDLYNDTYDYFCTAVTKDKARILEIGCGPGNITRYLLNKRPDFDLLGIDIAPNMTALASKNNPTARFTVMDCRQINRLALKFDGIIGGFCLPYLSQTETNALIADSYDLLNDNGMIYVSFVEGDPAKSGFKTGSGGRVYFYYHTLTDITSQLTISNFGELKIFKVKYKTSATDFDIHSIVTARKKQELKTKPKKAVG